MSPELVSAQVCRGAFQYRVQLANNEHSAAQADKRATIIAASFHQQIHLVRLQRSTPGCRNTKDVRHECASVRNIPPRRPVDGEYRSRASGDQATLYQFQPRLQGYLQLPAEAPRIRNSPDLPCPTRSLSRTFRHASGGFLLLLSPPSHAHDSISAL